MNSFSTDASYQRLDDYGSIPATIVETAFDTLNLFTHYYDPSPPNITRISSHPVTVLSNYSSSSTPWFGPAGLLGLGPRSTLLEHLYNEQLISSRSFGLYMGTAYEQSNGAINGSLTLGGYDSGRLNGDVHNFTISSANLEARQSPFKVSIQQMTLTDSDGKSADLLNNSIDAFITTSQYHINLPGAVQQQFVDATGATPSDDGLNVFRLPDDFNSDLTITLESGLELTYDASWLKNVSNNSPISTGTISDSTTNSTISLLGTAFLSNVYFIANYDSSPPTFHLANASPHGPYVFTETLCPNTVPTPAPVHKISSFAASGLTGAILGGVIGGIGLSFAVFWLLRKHLQRRMWRKQANQAMKGKGLDSESTIGGTSLAGGKGKGSPSTMASTVRGDSSEMATFAFDFNSQQHQAYATYLNNATSQQHSQQQQNKSPLSRTYTQFVKQISRENNAASSESLVRSYTPPAAPPQPPALNDPVSAISSHAPTLPVLQYARPRTEDSYSVSPITPATGVPLLLSQHAPGHSEPPASSNAAGLFHPLTLSLSHTHSRPSFENNTSTFPFGTGQGRGDEDSSFRARQARLRGSDAGGSRDLGLNLTVQTEFAPPPKSSTADRIARKAVGKEGGRKEGLLKKVFPPAKPGS